MKIAIYCRVSTEDKNQDPERQILKCRDYCDLHNHEIVKEIKEYHTGDSDPFTRPLGSTLLSLKIEGIVIFSMDRLTRQHPIKVIQMINSLKDRGIKIISITEPAFNMESEFSDIIIYIMTWFNNYFLTKLKKDIKAGIDKARAEGKQIGRAKTSFNEYRARELFKEGKSYGQVAKELGVSKTVVYNRFKNLPKEKAKPYINKAGVLISSVSRTPTSHKIEPCPKCNKNSLRWRSAYDTYKCSKCRIILDSDHKEVGYEKE